MTKRPRFYTAALAVAGILAVLAPEASTTAWSTTSAGYPALPGDQGAYDPVLEWNQIFNDTVLATTPAPNSLVTSRSAALLAAAAFDAVNGVDRRYRPLHVTARAPARASARAAAIQASYAMLIRLYSAHGASLTARRNASMALLSTSGRPESADAIDRGAWWGQRVADTIWTARQNDGFTPPMAPFMGSETLGFWRPTPPGNAAGSGPQFASMTPWVLTRPSQFRPPPPPALSSAAYATDYNETRMWGGAVGSLRSPDDSAVAIFWSGNGTLYWTRIATQLAAARQRSVLENAHLFAMLHVALADASIATWDAKYRYVFWRPVTAIRSEADDANENTSPEPDWIPFLTTSAHPEYPSGHSNLAGAATIILAAFFGDSVAFEARAETMPGAVRPFVGFADAVEEMADARVYGGMHFRSACDRGSALGSAVAAHVLTHAMRAAGGDPINQLN